MPEPRGGRAAAAPRAAGCSSSSQAELEALGVRPSQGRLPAGRLRRFGPYLARTRRAGPSIDRDKVRAAERLDGKFVLTTNDDTLSVADIALGYKGMWIIESCFRKMKTTGLELRPMFHWAPQRITAHVKLCVLALLIQRTAELRSGESWARLQDRLRTLKAVHHASEGRVIVQTTRLADDLRELLPSSASRRPNPSSPSPDSRSGPALAAVWAHAPDPSLQPLI